MVEPQQLKKTGSMESMWGNLPANVLERVFTYLPIASLCRFRTLSKVWNRFISGPTFKHARAAEEDYVLITQRWEKSEGEGGWMVLDVARKRHFKLSHAFLTEHVQRQWLVPSHAEGRMYLAAVDGGLFCVRYIFDKNSPDENSSGLFVCNPILKTVKQLPQAAGVGWGEFTRETVVMATDRSSMEYEIIILNTPKGQLSSEFLHVYESRTGRWRTVRLRPATVQLSWAISLDMLIFFNNNLYCPAYDTDYCCGGIYSCDKETGVVSLVDGIDLPAGLDTEWELVASKERLFCVIPATQDLYEIFEIDVVERASTRLTEMPQALVTWVMDKAPNPTYYESQVYIASADCIFISADEGRCAVYSLSHKTWYQFPEDRISQRTGISRDVPIRPGGPVMLCGGVMKHDPMYGSNSCLSLCAP